MFFFFLFFFPILLMIVKYIMHITFFSYLKLLRWHASEDTPNATTPWGTQEDDGDRQTRGTMKKTGCNMFVFIYFYLIFLNNFVTSYKNGTTTNGHDHQHLTPLQSRAFALSKFFFFVSFHFTYIILRLLMTYHHHSRSQMRCGVVFCVYFYS